jgi:hypothetical protein
MSCFSSATNTTTTTAPDPSKHVNYTVGMVLGVDDLTQEFAYLSGRDQWMARDLIGYGTVRGLKVATEIDSVKGPRVIVDPGVAVSPSGQMICVPSAQCAYLRDWVVEHAAGVKSAVGSPVASSITLYVVLCYRDCPVDNVPIAGEPCRSEDQLMSPSRVKDDFCLELRLPKVNPVLSSPPSPPSSPAELMFDSRAFQREEDAIRDFVDWFARIPVSSGPSTPLDQFLNAIRDGAQGWFSSPPPSSPLSDFMFGSPPGFLQINSADLCRYASAAMRLWVTELRPKWIVRWHGCAQSHFATDNGADEDCVLLAELTVPLDPVSPGTWTVPNVKVKVDDNARPYLVHLRMLQEWLMCVSRSASQIAPATLKLVNLDGPAARNLTDEQCVICNTGSGGIKLALPSTTTNDGRVIVIKRNTGGNAVDISAAATENIEAQNQTTISLNAQGKSVTLVANAKAKMWHVIANN